MSRRGSPPFHGNRRSPAADGVLLSRVPQPPHPDALCSSSTRDPADGWRWQAALAIYQTAGTRRKPAALLQTLNYTNEIVARRRAMRSANWRDKRGAGLVGELGAPASAAFDVRERVPFVRADTQDFTVWLFTPMNAAWTTSARA